MTEALIGAAPFVGTRAAIEKLKRPLARYAKSPFPVRIKGESGTGKETVAGHLHRTERGGKPFLALNCAVIFESGVFEDAADGSLFLAALSRRMVSLAEAP